MKKGISVQLFGSAIAAMKQAIFGSAYSSVGAGNTKFAAFGILGGFATAWNPTDGSDPANQVLETASVMPCAGLFKNLCVYFDNPPGVGGTQVLTLMKNGAATALTGTSPAAAFGPAVLVTDTTHAFSVVAGDVLSLRQEVGAGVTSEAQFCLAVEFDPV
jgi:hypothetical protein